MTTTNKYFVAAAVIAAKLNQATEVSRQLSLTASNARVIVIRAGDSAAGFRPLTDAIHSLADITVRSSKRINNIAASLSKTAVQMFRAERALNHFSNVYSRANGHPNLKSLDNAYQRTKDDHRFFSVSYHRQVRQLQQELSDIESELRSAGILKILCETEASRAKKEYQEAFKGVSHSVDITAKEIKQLIHDSRQQVAELN